MYLFENALFVLIFSYFERIFKKSMSIFKVKGFATFNYGWHRFRDENGPRRPGGTVPQIVKYQEKAEP